MIGYSVWEGVRSRRMLSECVKD